MADKEYVSIFVRKNTRKGLKEKAIKLGFPSMISLLEAFEKTPAKDLLTLRR